LPRLTSSSASFPALPFASLFPLHISCLLLLIIRTCLFHPNASKLRDRQTVNVLTMKHIRGIIQSASDADDESQKLGIVQCQFNWHNFRPEKTMSYGIWIGNRRSGRRFHLTMVIICSHDSLWDCMTFRCADIATSRTRWKDAN
jgi:hypothetical protein